MTKLAHVSGGVIDAFPAVDPVLAKEGFKLADCFHEDYLAACVEVDDAAAVGWTWDGKTAVAPPASTPGVRRVDTYRLLSALTDDQVKALSGAKAKDQRLLSARVEPWPETNEKIGRIAAALGTTPKAWFDAVLGVSG